MNDCPQLLKSMTKHYIEILAKRIAFNTHFYSSVDDHQVEKAFDRLMSDEFEIQQQRFPDYVLPSDQHVIEGTWFCFTWRQCKALYELIQAEWESLMTEQIPKAFILHDAVGRKSVYLSPVKVIKALGKEWALNKDLGRFKFALSQLERFEPFNVRDICPDVDPKIKIEIIKIGEEENE